MTKLEWRSNGELECAEVTLYGHDFLAERKLHWRTPDEVGLAVRVRNGDLPAGYVEVPGWENMYAAPSYTVALLAKAWLERKLREWHLCVSSPESDAWSACGEALDMDVDDKVVELAVRLAKKLFPDDYEAACAGGDN